MRDFHAEQQSFVLTCIVCWCALFFAAVPSYGRRDRLSFFDVPFHAWENPAFLSYQKFGPSAGTRVILDHNRKVHALQASLSSVSGGRAWAAAYNGALRNRHILTAAVSQHIGLSYAGGALDVYFENQMSPQFTFDLQAAALLDEHTIGSVKIENILQYRFFESLPPRGVQLRLSREWRRVNTEARAEAVAHDLVSSTFSYCFEGILERSFFNNPGITVSIGGGARVDSAATVTSLFHAFIGISFSVSSARSGVHGMIRFHDTGIERAYSGVTFNPYIGRDRTAPKVSIKINKKEIGFSSFGHSQEVLIAIKCSDNRGGVGIRNWTCIVTRGTLESSPVVRSFSGGDIPPATIAWDGRDAFGNIQKPGIFNIRFIAVDNNGNIGVSQWHEVEITD